MFKVGDRVEFVDAAIWMRHHGVSNGSVGIIKKKFADQLSIPVDMPAGNTVYCDSTQIKLITEPPTEITQEGWIYKKDRPVVAEWIKDGVWCVSKDDGSICNITVDDDGEIRVNRNKYSFGASRDFISEHFRHHEPSDWKWGDWAMYDGKRVFVMGKKKQRGQSIASRRC